MRFARTSLGEVWIVDLSPISDERGSFARTFCAAEFAEQGLENQFVQHSLSYSERKGTLRGMHYQKPPLGETKLISCVRGAIWDVVVDIRPKSPTYLQWFAIELSPENGKQLYIPSGFAHGFLTLSSDTLVNYRIAQFHRPDAACGLRYDDPAVAIDWPSKPSILSDRDMNWPLL